MKFPFYRQLDQIDCGPACLRMIAEYYSRSPSMQVLRERCRINGNGVSLHGLAYAAETIGFRTISAKIPFETLVKKAPLPCIVRWNNQHFVVVYSVRGFKGDREGTVYVADPGKDLMTYDAQEFCKHWVKSTENGPEGFVLLLEPTLSFYKQE